MALVLLRRTPAHAGGPSDRNFDHWMVGKPLLDMVTHGATSLSVMPAGGDDYDVLYVAWGDDAATPRAVQLALLRRDAGAARPTWSMHHDVHSLAITPMDARLSP